MSDHDREPEEVVVDFLAWFCLRLVFGPWLIMFAAGLLHHEVTASFPAWSWAQSLAMTMALIVFAWFFRR